MEHCGDYDPGIEQGLKKLVGLKLWGWLRCPYSNKDPASILLKLPSPQHFRVPPEDGLFHWTASHESHWILIRWLGAIMPILEVVGLRSREEI